MVHDSRSRENPSNLEQGPAYLSNVVTCPSSLLRAPLHRRYSKAIDADRARIFFGEVDICLFRLLITIIVGGGGGLC